MRSIKFIFIMAVLFAAVGSVSSDLYLPSLPAIANSFQAPISLVQLSVAVFVFGLFLARIVFGFASDAFGRRKPLIIGLVICFAGSLLCLFASSIYVLILGRLLQGFGGGGSNILGRVILRDRLEGVRLAKYTSYFSMAGIAMMASAPLFGGYIQHYFAWRACFVVLLVFAFLSLLTAIFILPETNIHQDRKYLSPRFILENLIELFTNRAFMGYALLLLLGYAVMLAWLTSGPIVLQKVLGLTPVAFGWMAGLVGSCYFLGAFINSRCVSYFGVHRMIVLGGVIMFCASLFMVLLAILNYLNIAVIVGPIMLLIFGLSFTVPNCYAAGLSPFPKTAGVAVAMLGTMQVVGGFLASTIIAYLPDKTQLPMSIVMLVAALLSLIVICWLRRSVR